jgi:hypothetical protein
MPLSLFPIMTTAYLSSDHFRYEAARDSYIYPAGKELHCV